MAVLKTVPSDVNIIIGPKGLGVFVDLECTLPLTALHWGDVARGQSPSLDTYLKNIETEPINVGANTLENISAWGSLVGAPVAVSLNGGVVKKMTITLNTLAGAPVGPKPFTMQFIEVP